MVTWSRLHNHVRHNVVGYIALFVALGGSAYAAASLPANSVGTKQLKNGAVKGKKLAKGAVTGAKVANNSLTGKQINAATLGAVPNAHHASSATNANHASGADSATNATNATSLGGSPASAYLKGSDSIAAGDLGGTYSAPTLNPGSVGTSTFGAIPGARATNSTAENVTDTTLTTLTFDTNDYDSGGVHSTSTNNSRLTAPVAGVYEITGDVIWHPNSAGTREMEIVKNGTTTVAYAEMPPGSSSVGQEVTTQLRLAAGDYVELQLFQNSTSTVIVSALSDMSPIFAMHWLGP